MVEQTLSRPFRGERGEVYLEDQRGFIDAFYMGERGACAGSWVRSLLFSFVDLLSLTRVSMEMVCLVFPKDVCRLAHFVKRGTPGF